MSAQVSAFPDAPELVRRVLEGLVERSLAFAHGSKILVEVTPAPGIPSGPGGITLTVSTLTGHRSALWVIPQDTWASWLAAWKLTRRKETNEAAEKAMMMLFTGGLDRWQQLAGSSMPAFPFPGTWEPKDNRGWTRISAQYHWYLVQTPTNQAWIGLEGSLTRIGERLLAEPDFRSKLREEVLGEVSGKLGAERPWEASTVGALKLKDDFVLGPCLLPVLGNGEEALVPRFLFADPDAAQFPAGEQLTVHTFGWDERKFSVIYRPQGLGVASGRLLPFAALVGRIPDAETWETVTELPDLHPLLRITAEHIPDGPKWELFLPADLLSALATMGTHPWTWSWLTSGADNLLRVFLQVNDRFRLGPPPGFSERSGLDWTVGWYAQTGQNTPPPVGMTVADLLAVSLPRDKTLLIQNILAPTTSLHPLQALFTWVEIDPVEGETGFQLAGFDRAGFRMLLPPRARIEWDASGLIIQTREELRDKNTEAMGEIWQAWRQGRIELSTVAIDVLREGYSDVQKAWRERRARELTGAGLGAVLESLKWRKDLGAVLQRPGPRALALALLFDAEAVRKVAQVCPKRFSDELRDQRRLWEEAFRETGPDLLVFQEARARVEQQLESLG